MKFIMRFVLLLSVFAAVNVSAAVATNRWIGATSGGSWSTVSNWETSNGSGGWTTDATLLATRVTGATTRANACVWDFTKLSTGAIVTLDYSDHFFSLGFVLGANKGNITLTGGLQYGCDFGNADGSASADCYFTIPSGTVLIWKLENKDQNWSYLGTGRTKLFQVQGGGTLSFDQTKTFQLYDRNLTVKDATVIFNRASFNLGSSGLFLNDSKAVVKLGLDMSFFTVNGTYADSVIDTGSYRLLAMNNMNFAGKIKGAGILDLHSSSIASLDGDHSAFDGSFVFNGVWLDRTKATSVSENSYQLEYGTKLLNTNKSFTVKSLTSYGVEDELRTANGATLTIGNAKQYARTCYNARITGGSDLVKAGANYELELSGNNSYAGSTRVAAGTLRTRNFKPLVSEGLLAFWTFEDYDRPFADITENALAITNCPTDASLTATTVPTVIDSGAKSRRSIHFAAGESPATAQCKSSTVLSPLAGDASFTHSFWIRPSGTEHYQNLAEGSFVDLLALGTASTTANSGVFLSMGVSGGELKLETGRSDSLIANGLSLFDGSWHNIAITYENRRRRIYVDGVQRAADVSDIVSAMEVPSVSAINYGYRNNAAAVYAGDMDNIMIFKRCLGAEEIAFLSNNNRPETNVAWTMPKPSARWNFDDSANPWKDISGVSNIILEPDTSISGAICSWMKSGSVAGAYDGSVKCYSGGYLKFKIGASWPSSMPSGNNPFSIHCRVRTNSSCNEYATIWYIGVPEAGKYLVLRSCNYPRQLCYAWNQAAGSTGRDFVCEGKYLRGAENQTSWMDITTVYDPTAKMLYHYVDGALVASRTLSQLNLDSSNASFRFMIGRRPDRTDNAVWVYDDFQVFNRALNAAEVKMVCRGVRPDATEAVLPVDSPVTVDVGAQLAIDENGPVTLKSINAAGELHIGSLTLLTLTDGGSISGTLSGSGEIALNGDLDLSGVSGDYSGIINAASRVDASRLDSPTIKVGDDVTWTLAAPDDAASYPFCTTGGKLVLPPNGTILFSSNPKKRQKVTLFAGGELVAPNGIEGWVVRPVDDRFKVTLAVEDNKLVATINPYRGSAIIYK